MSDGVRNELTYLECKLTSARETERRLRIRIKELEAQLAERDIQINMLIGDLAS